MKMTTWEVQKPYPHGCCVSKISRPVLVDRYTAVIDDCAIGRFDTSDEAYEAIIQELAKRLNRHETREKMQDWYDFMDEQLFSHGYTLTADYIDREMSMQPCPVCGRQGEYYGFQKYRAFSVCQACGHFLEF
jgi:hypothetical protein